jgi:hypothetical protein
MNRLRSIHHSTSLPVFLESLILIAKYNSLHFPLVLDTLRSALTVRSHLIATIRCKSCHGHFGYGKCSMIRSLSPSVIAVLSSCRFKVSRSTKVDGTMCQMSIPDEVASESRRPILAAIARMLPHHGGDFAIHVIRVLREWAERGATSASVSSVRT